MLGVILGVGLALLILVLFSYAFVRWYQRGQCWRRPDFVFNLYHTRCISLAGPAWPWALRAGAQGWLPSPRWCMGAASPCLRWRKRELPYPRPPQHVSWRQKPPSPRLRPTPALRTSRLRAQETLGQTVGEQGSRSAGNQLKRIAVSRRTGWLVLCNRGKCHKEMRLLQTSLLRQISGPMWKFILHTGSASKHLRKSPWAFLWFSCAGRLQHRQSKRPRNWSTRAALAKLRRPQEGPRPSGWGLPRHGGFGAVSLQTVSSEGRRSETQDTTCLCVGKLVRMEQRAPACTPACKGAEEVAKKKKKTPTPKIPRGGRDGGNGRAGGCPRPASAAGQPAWPRARPSA
ncbi:small integral membrane protein 35 isoform X2 [Strix uralensis]